MSINFQRAQARPYWPFFATSNAQTRLYRHKAGSQVLLFHFRRRLGQAKRSDSYKRYRIHQE